tara:strand:- start:496 stop:714 length:219 start_codon:yes stop_codon:yes gene_type:complete
VQNLAKQRNTSGLKLILLAQIAQILHRGLTQKTGGIALPIQQIKRRWRLAHQIAFYRKPVNQVVRAKITKRA